MPSSNNSFEQRFLFPFGRYFSSLVAVGGFICIGVGGIYFANSFERTITPFGRWVKTQPPWSNKDYYTYEREVKLHNYFVTGNRQKSIFLSSTGAGLIVAGSTMSIQFAIERNTRRIKEDD